MKVIASTLVLFLMLSACGSPTPSDSLASGSAHMDSISNVNVSAKSRTCYLHIKERDSVHMEINIEGDSIQGTLYFNNYQIDDSRGTISGRFQGDTLFVVYDFMAEGMHSRTAEAFLKQGDSLIRGFGDRQLVDETMIYQESTDISFDKGQVFLSVPCL